MFIITAGLALGLLCGLGIMYWANAWINASLPLLERRNMWQRHA